VARTATPAATRRRNAPSERTSSSGAPNQSASQPPATAYARPFTPVVTASASRKGPTTGRVIPRPSRVVVVVVRVWCVVVMTSGWSRTDPGAMTSEVMTVPRGWDDRDMDAPVDLTALAINVVIPEELRWRDTRRDDEFELQSLTIRMLPDGTLAAKAYGRPVAGGRGAYVSFPVPDRPELAALVASAADEAARRWAAHA
jgi:hypothetical protein